ncbi:40S ribosomal protein S10 [Blattella germanica]|nr:40S ribosomal protein S10 [Blattella germanica]
MNFVFVTELCLSPPREGSCNRNNSRWYFDDDAKSCQNFFYKGCNGNRNNFLTQEDCENTCLNNFEEEEGLEEEEENGPVAGLWPASQIFDHRGGSFGLEGSALPSNLFDIRTEPITAVDGPVVNCSLTMLMPKKNRVAIYEYLFKEGVMVAKKDFHAPKHPELEAIPNLQVIKAMQSLKSRGFVSEQFAWRHFYWYLTNDGINYLRNYLHLPPEIVPSTLKRQTRPETARPRPSAPRSEGARPAEDRVAYRRTPGAASGGPDKKADRGGFGRGQRGGPQ